MVTPFTYPSPQRKSLILNSSMIPAPKRRTNGNSALSSTVYSQANRKKSRVKVLARIRPLLGKERRNHQSCRLISNDDLEDCDLAMSESISPSSKNNGRSFLPQIESFRSKSTYLTAMKDNFQRRFNFDAVFSASATQEDVYEHSIGDAVRRNIFRGFNTTILAHGQSGSGKTYTMFGFRESETTDNDSSETKEYSVGLDDGIIPRAIQDLFQAKKQHESSAGTMLICLTYVEINNEEIRDLLADDIPGGLTPLKTPIKPTKSLRLRDAGNDSFFVESLEAIAVDTAQQVYELIEYGSCRRQTASTALNNFSNRSHSICTLNVTLTQRSNNQIANFDSTVSCDIKTIKTKLTMVDLAGSERVKELKDSTIAKARINVNKDLFTMTRVIGKLATLKNKSTKKEKDIHIPYRDSKITCLLRDSIGGNCCTIMIACVSPTDACFEESMNTLKYAEQTKQITVNPYANSYRQNLERAVGENRLLKSKLSEMKRCALLDDSAKGLTEFITRSSNEELCGGGSVDTTETESSFNSKLSSPRNLALIGEKLDLDIEKKKVTLDRLTREVSQAEAVLRTKGSLIDDSFDLSFDLNKNQHWLLDESNISLKDGEAEKGRSKDTLAVELAEMEAKRELVRAEIVQLESHLQTLSQQVSFVEQEARSEASGGAMKIAEISLESRSSEIHEVFERLQDESHKIKTDEEKIKMKSGKTYKRTNDLKAVEIHLKKEIDDLRLKLSSKTQELMKLEGGQDVLIRERNDALTEILHLKEENDKLQGTLQDKDKLLEEMRNEIIRLKEERNVCIDVESPVHIGGSISVKSNLTNGSAEDLVFSEKEDYSIASNGSSNKSDCREVFAAKMLLAVSKEIQKGFVSSGRSVASSVGSSNASDFRPNMKEIYAMLNNRKGPESESFPKGKPPLAGRITTEKEEKQIVISNIEKVSDGLLCTCRNSNFSGNAEYVNFYLPKLGMACTCGKFNEEESMVLDGDPLALKSILRSWQVEFLKTQNIHGAIDLVYAFKQRSKELAKAMRLWRKEKGLPAVKTKSCHAALLIWYRTCKAVVRSIRKQKAQGAKVFKKPNFLDSKRNDSNTVFSSGQSLQIIDMNLELEI